MMKNKSNQHLTLAEIQDFTGKYPKHLWYLFLIEMWEFDYGNS